MFPNTCGTYGTPKCAWVSCVCLLCSHPGCGEWCSTVAAAGPTDQCLPWQTVSRLHEMHRYQCHMTQWHSDAAKLLSDILMVAKGTVPKRIMRGDVSAASFLCGPSFPYNVLQCTMADCSLELFVLQGPDANLAIQYILNCGAGIAGSCHGGDAGGAYQFVKDSGHVPYDTCLMYEACSQESTEGQCAHKTAEAFTCSPINTCRTCSTFTSSGGFCSEVDVYPNASIAEYGRVAGEQRMMAGMFTCQIMLHPHLPWNLTTNGLLGWGVRLILINVQMPNTE